MTRHPSNTKHNEPHGGSDRVLVTRPAHQSAQFIQQLEARGVHAVLLPTIEIEFESIDLTETQLSDLIIFTSANAVTGACHSDPFPWNSKAKIAAVGPATATLLEQLNCPVDIVPKSGASSEALLDTLSNEISTAANLKVTIVRGDSGRDKLFNALSAQGAKPRYQSVYKRRLPEYSKAHIDSVLKHGLPDVVSVTSDLGLKNLLAIIPAGFIQTLLSKPLVVNSKRCAQLAEEIGFSAEILIAEPPGDDSQLVKILSVL